MSHKRILIIGSAAIPIINFRGDFIKSLISNGFEVFAAAPQMENKVASALEELGAIPLTYPLSRTGMNPFKDLKSIWALKRLILKHEINLVFPYTIKPVVYGSIAARMARISVVSLITGLGFTFSASSKKARRLQKLTQLLYRAALRKNKIVIFQNSDDLQLFRDKSLVSKQQRTAIVDGSGVNLRKFPYRVNDPDPKKISFVLITRLIREKGVDLFMKAAENLKSQYPEAEFHIIGEPDITPSAVQLEDLQEAHNKGIIVYQGFQKNISEILCNSDVFVLPTYYREGIPRSILEALSIGMPIITTNTPGCRETVVEGENGYLIPPKELSSLTEAMQKLLDHPELIRSMGIASRNLASQKFDVSIINKRLIELIDSI